MLTPDQRLLMARHLTPRTGDELQTATITLTKRQLAFIVEAVEHFEAERCPLKGGREGCQLLSWYESPATGAMETVCPNSCLSWRDELIEQLAPEAFPVG